MVVAGVAVAAGAVVAAGDLVAATDGATVGVADVEVAGLSTA